MRPSSDDLFARTKSGPLTGRPHVSAPSRAVADWRASCADLEGSGLTQIFFIFSILNFYFSFFFKFSNSYFKLKPNSGFKFKHQLRCTTWNSNMKCKDFIGHYLKFCLTTYVYFVYLFQRSHYFECIINLRIYPKFDV